MVDFSKIFVYGISNITETYCLPNAPSINIYAISVYNFLHRVDIFMIYTYNAKLYDNYL